MTLPRSVDEVNDIRDRAMARASYARQARNKTVQPDTAPRYFPLTGKGQLATALAFAIVENGWRVVFTYTTDLAQRLQIVRRGLVGSLSKPPSPRHQRIGRNQPPF